MGEVEQKALGLLHWQCCWSDRMTASKYWQWSQYDERKICNGTKYLAATMQCWRNTFSNVQMLKATSPTTPCLRFIALSMLIHFFLPVSVYCNMLAAWLSQLDWASLTWYLIKETWMCVGATFAYKKTVTGNQIILMPSVFKGICWRKRQCVLQRVCSPHPCSFSLTLFEVYYFCLCCRSSLLLSCYFSFILFLFKEKTDSFLRLWTNTYIIYNGKHYKLFHFVMIY